MGKNKKKGFAIKLEDDGWGRTNFHRPTRSIKEQRQEMHLEELDKEAKDLYEEEWDEWDKDW